MKYLLPLFYIISIFGCMGYYHHKVVNIGNQMLYGVEMHCNDRNFGYGYISPGVYKGYSGSIRIAKRDKVTISWGLDEEKRYSKEIYIDRNPGFKEVVFKLDGKDVTVGYE